MRIFVTGATGYLGGVLCRRLVGQGAQVKALVRATSCLDTLADLDLETVIGDVTAPESIRPAMAGCEWVVHAAADTDFNGPQERMRRINVEGSATLAALAREQGDVRLLAVSSVACFGASPADGSLADEHAPVRQPLPSPYAITKHAGQQAILEQAAKGLDVNIVYPSLIYGPGRGASRIQGANWMLHGLSSSRTRLLVAPGRLTSWVHVDDVADGIVRVIERAPAGRSFLLAGDVTTQRSLVDRLCALSDQRPPAYNLSIPAARALLPVFSLLSFVLRRRAPYGRRQLASLERHLAFDDTRARQELEWTPRDLSDGLPPTVEMLSNVSSHAARPGQNPEPVRPTAGELQS
ncbi:MAG: NAD-dependent epimerase/dehydratase family protein [Acidobacteriota bacterium]